MGKAEVDAFFADDPAPAAPVAPTPTSKVDAFFASDRAPSQESAALDPGELTRLGGDLWQTVYRGRKDEGENEDAAVKAANASVDALRAIGPDADKGRVRDALAAHVGPDTLDKTMTRAFGQRVYAAPLAEPNRAERDEARRESEREFRRATGVESIPDAWTKGAGDTGPRMVTEDEVKPWLQRTKAAAENIAAGVLTAGTLPLISKVAEWSGYAPILPDAPTPLDIPRTVGDVLNDRDVATLAGVDLDKKTIDPNTGLPGIVTGLVAKTPIPDAVDYVKIPQAVAALADSMKARGVPVPDVDAQTWVRFWDDARDYEAFDAANAAYYETGDRSKVDAIAFDQLPATLRGERPNAAMAKAAAESGDPDFAPLLQYADADEGFYQKQVEKLPIGALARLQTEVAPTFAELEQAFKARADAKKWRGDDQGQAALRLMSAGMLAPVGDGKALVVVPSKAAEAARLANTVWSGLMNVDIGVGGGDTIGEKIVGLPTALPRAALYLAEEAGVESAGTLRKRIKGSRLPTARGLETMATNPAFDDAMRFLGLATSQDYDVLDDPDSTWLSRTLADIADPEYGARHWADFLRRGGESESSTAMKAAEFADIAEQFVIPAEELALAPLTRSVAALNRARAAAYVARETGASSREARALALDAMRPRAYLDRDVIESANERLTRTALEGVANGTLDPDKVSPNVKRQVGEILNRTIDYSEDDVAKMWDDLRDRRMRILDTAKDIEMSGGPRTRELRASNEYRDTMRGLDDLVRTQNLSPQDRDVMRAFLEASAFSAYDRGAVGSPEEYFARHSWERGVEGEALPEGTLLSGQVPTREDWAATSADIKARHGLDTLYTSYRPDDNVLIVSLIRTPKDARGQGAATAAMREITAWADQHGATVALSPSSDFGASKSRLTDWYRSLGFKPNKGPSRDLRFSETMRRDPATVLKSESPGTVHGSIERAATPKTETPEFKAWFGDSKVVDAEGKPLVVYHGTTSDFDSFDRGGRQVGGAVFLAPDPRTANRHANAGGGRVLPVYAKVEKPWDYEDPAALRAYQEHLGLSDDDVANFWSDPDVALFRYVSGGNWDAIESPDFQRFLRENGYDGFWVQEGGERALGVYDPTAIKSATANVGTYDPTNPSILRSAEGGVTRGSISPGTPDTVNVPNPDYAAWEARVNALSAEVDALKAVPTPEPTEIPNPAFPEAVKRVQATDAEIRDLKQQASRAFGVNPAWTAWEAEIPNLANDPVALGRHMAAQPPKSAQHVNNALIAAKEAELATLRANIPPRTLVEAAPVDDVLNAKAEALARLRRFEIPKEVPKPSDVSRWLIKLFRTGDVKTAFHEGTHLLDLMMGEEWTRRAMEALGYDPTGPITTEVRERIAEAGTRALRGTLRPGSQLGNVFEDFRDTIGDVWRRVKREPAVTTPAFRKLWDKTFAPDDAEMMVAAHLVDQHGTGPLGRVVTTSGNVAEEIREGAQRAAGMAENAANVMRANQEIRQALGLTNDMTSIAVGDLLGRALAYTATTHALRGWGFGDLEGLTARTAVPAARAKRIQNEVAMYRKAVLGGKEAPTPVVVDGREVFMLNRDQQAGVRRMLADLANEPVSVDLPERLQDPRADLSQITREEWANIADRQLEVRAGAGAWRDRLAERAAVSAGIRFGQMAMDAARNQQSAVSAEANALRDAFVTTIAADEYLNPAAREVLKSVAREIGESGSRVKNAVIKAMNNGEKAWADAFKDVAASLPPEVVPVEELRTLRRVEPLATTDSFDEVAVGIPAISRLFTRAPVGSTAQMVQEQRSLSILDSIGLRLGGSEPPPPDVQFAPEVNPDAALGAFEQSATRFDDAIADAGYTRAEVDDAMATVQEGIKRRAAVFDNRASEIMHAFAGSDDVQVFAGMDPAKLTAAKYRAYESWYTGDWADNLLLNTELGQAARGPVYDQGMAVLNVLTRLEAAKVRASLARRLADVGVVADPASFLRGGVRLDRPYVFGTAANDVETITGEAYKQDVMHYLEAFTGWKMTSTNRLPTMETERVFAEATGMRAASGSVNKAAASDALRMIQSWGMKMGKGSAWETITLPDGGQIVMPTMFKEPIEKALADSAPLGGAFTSGPPKLGNIVPGTDEPIAAHYRAVNAALTMLGTAYQYSFGMLKTGLTTGMGPLIRPAFFMGNFIGGMGQLYQGVGAVKALEIMARPLLPTAEGRMTRAVIARMWNNGAGLTGTGAMMPAELGRFDAVGRWHSDQSLASGATRAGLNSSLVKTEFAQSIAEDIKAAEPTLWNRLMDSPKLKAAAGAVIGGAVAGPGGAVVGAGAFASLSRTWQDFFREAATGIDNYYRVSTYIGEVLRGVPEEQAAELARRVAFDYNNVTEFEKNYLRKGVLFYSFQRNNQNLFWWTLLNHPSRVMVQLRALRGAQQENYGEDAELFAPSWGEGRIPFRFRPAFEAGHADRAMQGAVTLTPRLSIADAVGLWQSLLGMTTELDPSAAGDLASKLNPWIQLSFVMSTGQDIHWQRSIEGFNTIPNWFVEMDENLTGGMVVNDLFGKVPAQYRNPSQEGYPGAPQWIVNPDGPHSRAWWVFRQMTMGGAMLDTITAMQRADFGDTLIEGGVVQKGVDLSRGAARADGREPLRNEPDTEMARSGLTEEEELGSWLGFKPVQVLDRDQALAPLIQRRESEQNAKMRTLKKEGERAYH